MLDEAKVINGQRRFERDGLYIGMREREKEEVRVYGRSIHDFCGLFVIWEQVLFSSRFVGYFEA